jgi:DnaJ-class molecular chaperone
MMGGKTYYEILEVPRNADEKTIRKAYLKLSLLHHPDKNEDKEEAKRKFVEIGQAYQVLSDPQARKAYDRELAQNQHHHKESRDDTTATATTTAAAAHTNADEEYENYADAFDTFVAGLSPEDLQAFLGTAGFVGGLLGSMLGAKLAGGGGKSRVASSASSTIGSMLGSAVMAHVAESMVKSLHETSVERVEYQKQRKMALERGLTPPPPPKSKSSLWQGMVHRTLTNLNVAQPSNDQKNDTTHKSNRNSSNSNIDMESIQNVLLKVVQTAAHLKTAFDQEQQKQQSTQRR